MNKGVVIGGILAALAALGCEETDDGSIRGSLTTVDAVTEFDVELDSFVTENRYTVATVTRVNGVGVEIINNNPKGAKEGEYTPVGVSPVLISVTRVNMDGTAIAGEIESGTLTITDAPSSGGGNWTGSFGIHVTFSVPEDSIDMSADFKYDFSGESAQIALQ